MGEAMSALRYAHWLDAATRKRLDYSLQVKLSKAQLPALEPLPPSQFENWPDDAQLDTWERNLHTQERATRELERNMCDAMAQVWAVLASGGKLAKNLAPFPPEVQAGMRALLAWHKTHRKQDVEAYREHVLREIARQPPNVAELQQRLARLNTLTETDLLTAGPQSWDDLLA
jgi:hypothetical protein